MAYEVTGDTVRDAVSLKLWKTFGYTIYFESIPASQVMYPHFTITLMSVTDTDDRRHHWFSNYFFKIEYKPVSNVAEVNNFQQLIDNMAAQFKAEIDTITLFDEFETPLQNIRSEKAEGKLIIFFNVILQVRRPDPVYALQEELTQNINVVEVKE